MSFLFVSRGSLQGLGDGITPMIGAVLELILRSVVPLLLSTTLGYTSICIAGPAAWTACAILMTIVYLWKMSKANFSV